MNGVSDLRKTKSDLPCDGTIFAGELKEFFFNIERKILVLEIIHVLLFLFGHQGFGVNVCSNFREGLQNVHSELFEDDLVQNVQHISVRGVKGVQRHTVEEVNLFFDYFFVALGQNVIWVGSELIGQSGCILILFKGR
jgi:hypothetical protein